MPIMVYERLLELHGTTTRPKVNEGGDELPERVKVAILEVPTQKRYSQMPSIGLAQAAMFCSRGRWAVSAP